MSVKRTIVGHGKDRNLSDRSVTALHTTSTFVDGRQIGVHVTGVTTTTGHFFTSSRDLETMRKANVAIFLTSRKASAYELMSVKMTNTCFSIW